jgi:hypothetical protein
MLISVISKMWSKKFSCIYNDCLVRLANYGIQKSTKLVPNKYSFHWSRLDHIKLEICLVNLLIRYGFWGPFIANRWQDPLNGFSSSYSMALSEALPNAIWRNGSTSKANIWCQNSLISTMIILVRLWKVNTICNR